MDFSALLSTSCQRNESIHYFEARVEAQLCRVNEHNAGSTTDAVVVLMLLGNSNVEKNQRVSILAAAIRSIIPTV